MKTAGRHTSAGKSLTDSPGKTGLYFNQRLQSALDGMLDAPLCLVEAPMGYGKSLAVREFIRLHRYDSAWVQSPGGGSENFWRVFCRELREAFPRYADIAAKLLRLGYPYDSVLAKAALELLLQMDFAAPTFLVVDDCHLLPDHGFAALCWRLADEEVYNLHLVLISRSPLRPTPKTDAAESAADPDPLFEFAPPCLGREYFSLTAPEIRDYFALNQAELSDEQVDELAASTGGWLSSLHLYLQRFLAHGVLARPGRLLAMLGEEVFQPLPVAGKELLLRLVLCEQEEFSLEQAAFLIETPGRDLNDSLEIAGEILESLSARNAFVARRDPLRPGKSAAEGEGRNASGRLAEVKNPAAVSFTIHAMLRDYLNERAALLPPEQLQAFHRRNGQWFQKCGETVPCVRSYYQAGDFAAILSVLDANKTWDLTLDDLPLFTSVFAECPPELRNRHLPAAFKYAVALFSANIFDAFGAQLAWLAERCASLPTDEAGNRWRGELEVLYSFIAFNDIRGMSAHHRRADSLLKGVTSMYDPDAPWTLGSPSILYLYYRENLAEELRHMRECLPHYYRLANNHGAGAEHVMEAEAAFMAGDFENADILGHRAEAAARRHGQLSILFCVIFLRMRLSLMRGEIKEALALGREMRGLFKRGMDFFMLYTADLCEGYLSALSGRADRAPEWLLRGESGSRLSAFSSGPYYLTHGRILLASGNYAKIMGLFGYLLEAEDLAKHRLFHIYARVYLAGASASLGRRREAAGHLRAALEVALPDSVLMPFVENFDFLESLLRDAVEEGGGPEPARTGALEKILHLGAAWEKSKRRVLAEYPNSAVPLTRRELELARLSTRGMKYREIAETLHLAPSTVKKAFTVMYGKIGISGRSELRAYLAARGLAGQARK